MFPFRDYCTITVRSQGRLLAENLSSPFQGPLLNQGFSRSPTHLFHDSVGNICPQVEPDFQVCLLLTTPVSAVLCVGPETPPYFSASTAQRPLAVSSAPSGQKYKPGFPISSLVGALNTSPKLGDITGPWASMTTSLCLTFKSVLLDLTLPPCVKPTFPLLTCHVWFRLSISKSNTTSLSSASTRPRTVPGPKPQTFQVGRYSQSSFYKWGKWGPRILTDFLLISST